MASPTESICAVAGFGGFASWLLYFHRFECHMHALLYLGTFLGSCLGGFLYLTRFVGEKTVDASFYTSLVALSYLAGLYGSMMFWRIFLNPMNKLPGPWPARLGGFWWTLQLLNSDAYLKLQALHKKYGPVVRIGSNDLSIIDPSINEDMSQRHSSISKGWWYDGDTPLTSMHTTRDRALHDARRKVWSPAFSEKAIRDYEIRISGLVDTLVNKIKDSAGKAIDVTLLFNLFTFDSMSLLAFGRDYGMLEQGKKHPALKLLGDGMQPLAYFFSTWLFRIMATIPGASAGYQKFVQFCIDEVTWRVKNADEAESKGGTDIMSWILRAYKGIDKPYNDPMLQADARLIIVAGSDTTAATLTYLFYHLAKNPDQVEKLRAELRPLTRGNWSNADIANAKHLNGCIWETLRLNPPVPSGVQRLTPKEGMQVGDKHIPGNAIFWMPQYVMGRGMSSSCSTHDQADKLKMKSLMTSRTSLCPSVGTASPRWYVMSMPGHHSRSAQQAVSGKTWLSWRCGSPQHALSSASTLASLMGTMGKNCSKIQRIISRWN